jgi:xanthine dehydrogenase accessory factor
MKECIKKLVDLLEKRERVVLATVFGQKGSTPRTVGAKMIVRSDGTSIGTIGGGLVEYKAVTAAQELFDTGTPRVMIYDLRGANAESMDMICGGSMEVLLEPVKPSSDTINDYKGLLTTLEKGRKCYVVSNLGRKNEPMTTIDHCILMADGSYLGTCPFPPSWLQKIMGETTKERMPVLLDIEDHRVLVEPSFVPGTVYLFGAGHVGQAVAELAAFTDFRTVVMDDREEYANRLRFDKADEILVLSSFDRAFDGSRVDGDSYLVIVTRGHRHDLTVLRQALRTQAGYIGMIGSRRKRDALYNTLLSEGFTREDISRVNSPIGLDIGADTPSEIAVSIVAELIKRRAERNGR